MAQVPQRIAARSTCFLDKPPCCFQFYPKCSKYFVVGTYDLVSSEERASGDDVEAMSGPASASGAERNGSLVVFEIASHSIIQLSAVEVPYGVLDMKFNGSTLGVATSVGSVALFDFCLPQSDGEIPHLVQTTTIIISDPGNLVTSFAWDMQAEERRMCATLTTGEVGLVTLPTESGDSKKGASDVIPAQLETLHTHELEAWIVAYAPDSWHMRGNRAIFSGGDDAILSCLSLVSPEGHVAKPNGEGEQDSIEDKATVWTEMWTNRRIHGAGVTAILPLTLTWARSSTQPTRILLTGSYDDTLRVLHMPWDTINNTPGRPRTIHEAKLDGGVWRLTVLSISTVATVEQDTCGGTDAEAAKTTHVALLASCMYAGAYIITLTLRYRGDEEENGGQQQADGVQFECEHEVTAHFTEHRSICYACDAQPLPPEENEYNAAQSPQGPFENARRNVVSCSFYDRRVCLWRW